MISQKYSYGIVLLSNIPVRKEPSERSEMVTQLLFGETLTILRKDKNWLLISNDYDKYEGWVSENNIDMINDDVYNTLLGSDKCILQSMIGTVKEPNKADIYISMGSTIPLLNSIENSFHIGNRQFKLVGKLYEKENCTKNQFIDNAIAYLNAPYLWGGRSVFGIDCSGYVQQVAKSCGIKLNRDASQQYDQGKIVNNFRDRQVGDLAFFVNNNNKIIHVGIILNENDIIHASGKVRVDTLDEKGIYNFELGKYTHQLYKIKRIIY